MRALFITERYPPHIMGGYEVSCAAVAAGLSRLGHHVCVLTSDFGRTAAGIPEGCVYRSLHYCDGWPNLRRLARQEFSDRRAIQELVAEFKPDLIYTWCMLHLFPSLHRVLKGSGLPIVYNIQDIWLPRHLEEAERLRSLWLRPTTHVGKTLARALLRKTLQWMYPGWLQPILVDDLPLQATVFCSYFRLQEHLRLGLPAGRMKVIYNGIDASRFNGGREFDAIPPLRVLFVGRLVEEKGAHTAVLAIKELHGRGLKKVTLSIAGVPSHPWEYADELKRTVAEASLTEDVRFLGMIAHDALPGVYQQHDVLCFPSMVNEGMPMTLLEAMACGLAVVGTTTGGSGEILQEGVSGLTFAPGDAHGLADRLQQLLIDPVQARTLASAGQQLVRSRFGIESAVAQTEAFLQEVLDQHGGSPVFRVPPCQVGGGTR